VALCLQQVPAGSSLDILAPFILDFLKAVAGGLDLQAFAQLETKVIGLVAFTLADDGKFRCILTILTGWIFRGKRDAADEQRVCDTDG
ncbi:MAG: hypothetical protein ACRD8U_03820, partial [Pyrinomonadaceae bacterium]